MNARLTTSTGRSEAVAIASVITPSSAPWRTSPVSSRMRKSCSPDVALSNRLPNNSFRRLTEPAPEVTASSSSRLSTSATVHVGLAAACARAPESVRQPIPSRPCSVSPDSQATTARTSCGAAPRNRSAMARVFAFRERVAATAALVVTTSSRCIRQRYRLLRTGPFNLAREGPYPSPNVAPGHGASGWLRVGSSPPRCGCPTRGRRQRPT